MGGRDKGKTEEALVAVARGRSEKGACRITPIDTDGLIQLKGIPSYRSTGSGATMVKITLGGSKENRRIDDDRRICNRFTRLGTFSKDHVLTLRTGQRNSHQARAIAVAITGQIPERKNRLIQKNGDRVIRRKSLAGNCDLLLRAYGVS